MDKKAISEIKKLLKGDEYIDRIRGCYVNEQGEIIREVSVSLSSLEKESLDKYCELLRACLSGKTGRNLFNMEFPLEEEAPGRRQNELWNLLGSELKEDARNTAFFEALVEKLQMDGKYLILLAHGLYDVPFKGKDRAGLEDASDTVYSFLLCCVCPVILMKEGLCYDEETCSFLDRCTDWAVQKPAAGFLYPAFNDRAADIHSLLYYSRKEGERHEELSADFLGCSLPMPESDQKDLFRSIVEQTLGRNCDFTNVRDLNDAVGDLIREQEEEDGEPVRIEKSQLRRLLYEHGAPQEVMEDFDEAYDEAIGKDVPLMAENITNTSRLEVKSPHMKITVNADMSEMLTTRVIDGREYLLIPVVDEIEVNGIRILQSVRKEETS